MQAALLLAILQGPLGALDTLYYHEFRLRLSLALTARTELKLHSARDFFIHCNIRLFSLDKLEWLVVVGSHGDSVGGGFYYGLGLFRRGSLA
jgi:hypothetical protein